MNSKKTGKSAAGRKGSTVEVSRLQWREGGELRRLPDELAREEPLEIRVRGQGIAVTMRTPGDDEELAAGFLLSEGLVKERGDIVGLAHCHQASEAAGNILNVFLGPHVIVDFERLTRHVFASSSCGLCGKATIAAIRQEARSIHSDLRVSPATLLSLPGCLREAQAVFQKTGGLHAAGVFRANGELMVIREDVGRHNAVDKALGFCFLEGRVPLGEQILLVSGRASFEILQKAVMAGVSVIASVSAPSSLAVEFAEESGQTLVGFLREGSFNIYCHPERVVPVGARLLEPGSPL